MLFPKHRARFFFRRFHHRHFQSCIQSRNHLHQLCSLLHSRSIQHQQFHLCSCQVQTCTCVSELLRLFFFWKQKLFNFCGWKFSKKKIHQPLATVEHHGKRDDSREQRNQYPDNPARYFLFWRAFKTNNKNFGKHGETKKQKCWFCCSTILKNNNWKQKRWQIDLCSIQAHLIGPFAEKIACIGAKFFNETRSNKKRNIWREQNNFCVKLLRLMPEGRSALKNENVHFCCWSEKIDQMFFILFLCFWGKKKGDWSPSKY